MCTRTFRYSLSPNPVLRMERFGTSGPVSGLTVRSRIGATACPPDRLRGHQFESPNGNGPGTANWVCSKTSCSATVRICFLAACDTPFWNGAPNSAGASGDTSTECYIFCACPIVRYSRTKRCLPTDFSSESSPITGPLA